LRICFTFSRLKTLTLSSILVRTVETVPCNEAWTVLKAHPNIAFASTFTSRSLLRLIPLTLCCPNLADLQLLAEVVSKRTHCSGPVASPSTSHFPASSPHLRPSDPSSAQSGASSASPRPQLAPQATLQRQIDAGVRKRLTVERGAVNEALELLDRAAARGGSLRR